MSRLYEELKGDQRKIADEAYRALVRELRTQGVTSVPCDDRFEVLVNAIANYMEGCTWA